MNLSTAIALPVFCLTLQSTALYSRDNNSVAAVVAEKTITAIDNGTALRARAVTYGRGIELIVKGLGLNIDNIRFIKEPKATDYCTYADNKASYASAIIIAANNGIKLSRTQRLNVPMTREQFAVSLNEAIQSTGQYPVNMMWINIKDEKSFSGDALNAVQNLVKFRVVALENGSFRPKAVITETEAAQMVKQAATFINSFKDQKNGDQSSEEVITYVSNPVNPNVNSIVVSRGSKPNSGYQIKITGITFSDNGTATIRYKLSDPEPGKSYMQMITEPKAETFIPASYKEVLLEKEQ